MSNYNSLTPKDLATNIILKNEIYEIPIYQRLFEWDEDKISQLLDDLDSSYKKNDHKDPYYIGMLTSTIEKNLVDGQQRFTVLMLMGCVFKKLKKYSDEWRSFLLTSDSKIRLHFSARSDDNEYLEYIIHDKEFKENQYVNTKMNKGIKAIDNWLNNKDEDYRINFSIYVFEHITFFITELPKDYSGKDLNKYFESMNSTGRNLENHEILKIKCLQKLPINDFINKEQATKIWNAVQQMDKPVIGIKKTSSKSIDELTDEDFKNTLEKSILQLQNYQYNDLFSSLFSHNNENDFNSLSIYEIANSFKPVELNNNVNIYYGDYHSMLKFNEFLLLVLYIQIDDKSIINNVSDFFDINKLLEVFDKYTSNWNDEKWIDFYHNLLKYRLLMDYFVIQIPCNKNSDFKLEFRECESLNDKSKDKINPEKEKLVKFQSMLWANSSSKTYYKWLSLYLEHVDEFFQCNKVKDIKYSDLLNFLKINDNKDDLHSSLQMLKDMIYPSISFYWFRRLEYYLWEEIFTKNTLKDDSSEDNNEKKVIELICNYRFRKGGLSVEHLHPQNENEQVSKWNNDSIHRFGNLALISSSFNSTQSNDSIKVKFARVEDQITRNQLESIKLYYMYEASKKEDKNWTEVAMKEHEDEMYKVLEDSYNQNLEYLKPENLLTS